MSATNNAPLLPPPTPEPDGEAQEPRGPGRPSKYTPERVQRIVQALQAGSTRKAACQYAGISDETFATWLRENLDFLDAVTQAETAAELRCNTTIMQAIRDGSTTDAWKWLERRRAEDYGRVDRTEITVRREAEKLAAELGLNADELLSEAERILRANAPARGGNGAA